MKFHLLTLALVASMVVSLPVSAEEHTALGKQMEQMDDAFKAIRKETDAAKGVTLARTAQESLIKSLSETPELVKKMPEAERPKAIANYRTMIAKALVTFSEIEEAFLANDLEKVKTLAEAVREQKKAGHDKYMEEDK